MSKRRTPTWLFLLLAPLALLALAIPGMWIFMGATAESLHPASKTTPTVAHSASPPQWQDPAKKARQFALAHLAEQNLPGLSIAVGIDGAIVWAEGFGFADLNSRAPVTPDHRFRIGTASTVLTSAAAGLLLEKGQLKLDEEIQTYVPSFPKKKWPVTLRHLMTHTSGLFSDGGDEGPLFAKHCEQPAQALPHFADVPLLFQPGAEFRVSNYGWIPVSAAMETAAGQPFLTFMQQQVFDPLEMRATTPDTGTAEGDDEDFPLVNLFREKVHDPETKRSTKPRSADQPPAGLATPYFPRFMADPKYGLHLMRPIDYSCYSGAAIFTSTPSDLVRFGMAINGGKLLKPATVERLQTPQRLASGKETDYGLGWQTKTAKLGGKPARIVGHDGHALGGMVASLITLPGHRITVAVLSNISYADTSSLAEKVAQAFAAPN